MANVYTSTYTGEQIDASVAATEVLETSINNIIDGTQVVGQATNATNDGQGNNIQGTYATKTSVSGLSSDTGTISGVGWHTIATCNILNGASAVITFKQMYTSATPTAITLCLSQTGYNPTVLTCLGAQYSSSASANFKARYLHAGSGSLSGNCFVQIYNPYSGSNECYVTVVSGEQGGVVASINNAVDSTATPDDGKSVEIDLPANVGINTSGSVLQGGNPVLSFDVTQGPSLMENWPGWEIGSLDTDLSAFEAGLYQIADESGGIGWFYTDGTAPNMGFYFNVFWSYASCNGGSNLPLYINTYSWNLLDDKIVGRTVSISSSSVSISDKTSVTLHFRKVM